MRQSESLTAKQRIHETHLHTGRVTTIKYFGQFKTVSK